MSSGDGETCVIDGFGPLPLRQPNSVAELQQIVRQAREARRAVYPLGGRTCLGLGLPPTREGEAVDLRGLDQIIDYPARDMTITVQAGITMARLQEILRAENQGLPVDIPLPDQATLGGAIATNASGPRRYGLGTLRDYVIGMSVVNDQGDEVKAGGRVVKNVAGYDLCKLYIGSLGTLGIVTQVTLKVTPIPEQQALVVIPCDPSDLELVLDRLHVSKTRPVCIEVLSPGWTSTLGEPFLPERWAVVVGYEDNRLAVEWQLAELSRELPDEHEKFSRELKGADAASIGKKLTDLPADASGTVTFKANLRPSRVATFCRGFAATMPRLYAHAGNGIVFGHGTAEFTQEQARGMIEQFSTAVAGYLEPGTAEKILGGFRFLTPDQIVLMRCPPDWKTDLPVWGQPRGDWEVMRAVKTKLDPKRIFNPGRFVGGI